ncbi:hypothetical protein F511_34416 [Dorcoceras hygrometricum]|uniref:Uncharacterized protein n=1 Tax=Dorcoceras hygrometricum TaxID=472368 RepID=A0A2Z7ASE6_9LAMI|nr:hypothetical protein F511_34416 [Dorcoceras hygrometricum]
MSKTDLSAKSNRSHALAQLQNDGVQAPDLHTSPADLLTSSSLVQYNARIRSLNSNACVILTKQPRDADVIRSASQL